MNRTVRPIRFGLVFLGLFFFSNPYIAVIDLLPDCIGCLLIWLGLSRASDVCADMGRARKAFLKLAAVDVIKNLALIVIMGMGSNAEMPTALLLAAFSAAVASLFFLLPAIRALFEGFLTVAYTYDVKTLYCEHRGKRSRVERFARLTVRFLLFREAVCLLPEFSALTTSTYSDSGLINLYQYIGIMRGFSCILVCIFALIWLVALLRFAHTVRREQALCIALGNACHNYRSAHPGIAVQRRHGGAFLLLLVACLLFTDFYLDFKNVFPDVLAAALLAIGALIPSVKRKYRHITAALAVIYGITSVLSQQAAYHFAISYSPGEISRSAEASSAYQTMWLLSLLEFGVFLGLLASLLFLLRAVIQEWAGYRPMHPENDLQTTAFSDASVDNHTQNKAHFEGRCQTNLLSEFDGRLIRCFVLGFVSALLSFLYDYIQEMPGRGILHFFEFLWIFDFCAALAFGIAMALLLSDIYREIKNRYQYD